MNYVHSKKLRRVFLLSVCLVFLGSCDTVNQIKTSVLEWTGFSEVKRETATDKSANKPEKDTTEKPKNPDKESKPTETADLVVSKTEEAKLENDNNLKQPKAPQFKVEAPVDVQRRVGGVARLIKADEQFIYIDFPQHFAVYDYQLNFLGRAAVSYPVVEVKKISKDDKTWLYLKEEKNTFEVVEITHSEQGHALKITNSFEVDGDFYWVHPELMMVFLKDKVQFLNLANLNDIKIINETPITNVNAAILVDKYLYIAHNGFLDVLDLNKFSSTASIRIGRRFGFLGTMEKDGTKDLLLSYLSNHDELEGIQYLHMTDDKTGIKDFGENALLDHKLKNISVDLQNQLLVGETIEGNGSTELYSIANKRFLRGPLNALQNLVSGHLFDKWLFLITSQEISVQKISTKPDVISQAASLKQVTDGKSQNTPLAQIGAEKTLKDEFNLSILKKMDFMSDARKVLLMDTDHILIMENTRDQKFHHLLASTDFSTDNYVFFEPSSKIATKYDKTLVTSFGILAWSRLWGEIHFLDVSLKTVQVLPLKIASLSSWTYFSSEENDYLAIITEQKMAGNKPALYEVTFYQLLSPSEIKPVQKIKYALKPFVFYVPENQIVVLTSEKMELFQSNILLQPEAKNIPPAEAIDIKTLGKNFLAAQLSPKSDTIYTLVDSAGKNEIFVMSLMDVSLNTTLSDIDITPEQFEGASFSKQGRLFILPTAEGTLFYDMTKISKAREVAHWPIPSEHVDIAAGGEFICVALGFKGVYCGKLLF